MEKNKILELLKKLAALQLKNQPKFLNIMFLNKDNTTKKGILVDIDEHNKRFIVLGMMSETTQKEVAQNSENVPDEYIIPFDDVIDYEIITN